MEINSYLFGCCTGEKHELIREYQRILAKLLIEEREFFDDMLPGLDINTDFCDSTLRKIIGTLIDMRSRYDADIDYASLQVELLRKFNQPWDAEEIKAHMEWMEKCDLDSNRRQLCKEQFLYWRQFGVLAKIANATCDMLREPWFQTDGKLRKMIEEVKFWASKLEVPTGCRKTTNDW